jgi:hypothetical protein
VTWAPKEKRSFNPGNIFGAKPFAAKVPVQLEYLPSKPPIQCPPNRGFAGDPAPATLIPGTTVDRFGFQGGTFVSPTGTPYIHRPLAPGTQCKPYNVYEVVKPIDVKAGPIAPAFDMPGGGFQFELPSSANDGGFLWPR